MILRSSQPDVVVGQVYQPKYYVTFQNVTYPPQPLFIVREATYAEWAAECNNDLWGDKPGMKYYEVHVD